MFLPLLGTVKLENQATYTCQCNRVRNHIIKGIHKQNSLYHSMGVTRWGSYLKASLARIWDHRANMTLFLMADMLSQVYRVKNKLDLEKQSSLATEQSLCIPISMQPFKAIHNGAPHLCFSSLSPCIGHQPDILGFPQTGLFFLIPAFVHVASSSIYHLSPPHPPMSS